MAGTGGTSQLDDRETPRPEELSELFREIANPSSVPGSEDQSDQLLADSESSEVNLLDGLPGFDADNAPMPLDQTGSDDPTRF